MKKPIFVAIALTIVGLMIAVSASSAIQTQEQKETTFFVDHSPSINIAEMETAEIKETIQPVKYLPGLDATQLFPGYHPAVASDSLGFVVLGFEDDTPNVYFTASDDNGANWATDAIGWMIDPAPTLPDIDSCGDGRFIGTMVPDYMASDGSELYKVEVLNPMDLTETGYFCPYWSWWDVGDGYTDFTSVAVGGYTAEDPTENEWGYGGHAMVGDHGGASGEDTAFFSYQCNADGVAWIYRFSGLNGATDCAMDIDHTNLYSYSAWNFDNEGDLDLYVKVVDFGEWVPYGGYQQHPDVTAKGIQATGNDNYIDISAHDDNIIIVSERDGDVVAYYSKNGMSSVTESAIEGSAVNPRIVHVGDEVAVCTFIKGESPGNVYFSYTEDGGVTWSAAEMIDEPENTNVPEEYKASDISGAGAAWMSQDDDYVYFAGGFLGDPPGAPTITGPSKGSPGKSFDFKFNAVDPDGNDVKYIINWGDETTDTSDFASSGTDVTVSHIWDVEETYIITVKAQDSFGNIGPESTHEIVIPRNKEVNYLILRILERYPNLFSIVQILSQFLGV
jgi:hypothetical protein